MSRYLRTAPEEYRATLLACFADEGLEVVHPDLLLAIAENLDTAHTRLRHVAALALEGGGEEAITALKGSLEHIDGGKAEDISRLLALVLES